MIHIAHTVKRLSAAAATALLAATAVTMAAAPATAESDDIDITKTADVATAAAGDTVTYTVEVRGSDLIDLSDPGATSDEDVQIFDQLPPHMTFVPGSASVTFNEVGAGSATHLNPSTYSGGTGWAGNWTETNDDGTSAAGDIRIDSFLGAYYFRLRDPAAPPPAISRTVNPSGTVRSVFFTFLSAKHLLADASDTMVAEMSFDGGTTWPVSEVIDGSNGDVGLHALSATGIAADTVTVRFRVTSSATWGSGQFLTVSGFNMLYAYDTSSTTTPLVDGAILDGFGNLTVGTWDVSYAETVVLTYQMTVNDVIEDTTTMVSNVATATSPVDDPAGESAQFDLLLDRNPDFDITVTNNGPVHIGQPLVVTVHVDHSDASDGYPLCSAGFESDTPPDFGFTYVSGDTDTDGCIDYGEEWVFTKTFSNLTGQAGAHTVDLVLFGDGPDQGEFDVELFLEDDYTVVLADSGAPDESATGTIAVGLILVGSAMLAYSRRKFA